MGTINTRHLIFILSGLAIVALKTFPSAIIALAGRDSWISVAIASLMILLFIIMLTVVSKRTGNSNLHDIYVKTFGKVIGTVLSFLFMLTVLLSIFESAGVEASVMHEGFLIATPIWVFIAVSVLFAVYIAKKGIASVTILAVIAIFFISLSGVNLAFLTQKYKEIKYLFPMMENGITTEFVLSVLKALGMYSCAIIFLPYLNSVEDKTKLTRHCVIALLFIVQVEIYSTLGVITTFGPDRAENLVFPKLTQTQIISAFGFLEAGELFVMLQIVAGWFMRLVLCLFALMEYMRQAGITLRFKEYYIGALTITFSYLLSKNLFDLFKLMDRLFYIQLINFFVIPLIVYPVYYFKHKRAYGIALTPRQDTQPAAVSSGDGKKGRKNDGGKGKRDR